MSSDPLKEKRKLAVGLGEVFREARQAASLTQADVAERAGLVTEVYGRVERGRMLPSLPKLRRLCVVLRVDANAALKLVGQDAPTWLEETPEPPLNDSPRMRRLQRTLRQLDEEHLAALHVMAHTLAKLYDRRGAPGTEEEELEPDPLTT
jgi:transcriptional regulator with XRE-family HTH domain